MEDDPEAPQRSYPLPGSAAKLSKTPSWVMLGFIGGACFVYAMMRREEAPAPAPGALQMIAPAPLAAPRAAPPLSTIEAVFEQWGEYAVWSGNTTEVALWNKDERQFSDCYEVRRIAGQNFFRIIPELTRRVIRHGRELPDSPLQFTETEEQYREWREHGRTERRPEGASLSPSRINPVPPRPAAIEAPPVPPPSLPAPTASPSPEEPK